MKKRINYIQVTWSEAGIDDPVCYYDEIGQGRWSVRCVREYADGTRRAFCHASHNWRDLMPEAAIPTLHEINAVPQFVARKISKRQFEELWSATYGLNQYSMMEPMLALLPDFRPDFDVFVLKWKDSPHNKVKDGLPLYLVLATLARFLAGKLEDGDDQIFWDVFALVEHWLFSGDHYVRTAAGAGLLEDLQNPVHYRRRKPADFLPWFLPLTTKTWQLLSNGWAGRA